jgi:hypothetical protein
VQVIVILLTSKNLNGRIGPPPSLKWHHDIYRCSKLYRGPHPSLYSPTHCWHQDLAASVFSHNSISTTSFSMPLKRWYIAIVLQPTYIIPFRAPHGIHWTRYRACSIYWDYYFHCHLRWISIIRDSFLLTAHNLKQEEIYSYMPTLPTCLWPQASQYSAGYSMHVSGAFSVFFWQSARQVMPPSAS